MKENNPRQPPQGRAPRQQSSPQHQQRDQGRGHSERKDFSNAPITKWEGLEGKQKIKEWIEGGLNNESLTFARAFGDYLAAKSREEREEKRKLYGEPFQSSSIRAVYAELTVLAAAYDPIKALMLRPRLQYLQSEASAPRGKALAIIADAAMEAILGAEQEEAKPAMINNLILFLEMVLSYHKAAGGR